MEKLFNGGNDTITPIDRVPDHVTYSLCTARRCDSRGLRAANGECEDKHKKNMRPRFWSLASVSLYILYFIFYLGRPFELFVTSYTCVIFFSECFFFQIALFSVLKEPRFVFLFFFQKRKDSSSECFSVSELVNMHLCPP